MKMFGILYLGHNQVDTCFLHIGDRRLNIFNFIVIKFKYSIE